MEFLASAFGSVRKFLDQLQPPSRKPDGFLIRKSTDVVLSGLLKIHRRPPMIPAAIEMHRKLGGDFRRTFAVCLLFVIPDSSVQLDASGCGYSLIQHVLI